MIAIKGISATIIVAMGLVTTSMAASINGQGTWEATLQPRDLDGNASTIEAYYDTTLDVTWLTDANYARTIGYDADGRLNLADAITWTSGLTLGGYNDWRVPTMSPVNRISFDISSSTDGSTDRGYAATTTDGSDGAWRDESGNSVSELGHMFYVTLGNSGYCDPALPWCTTPSVWGPENFGPFSNIQSYHYWTSAELNTTQAWRFNNYFGLQSYTTQQNSYNIWVLRDGDVSSLPIPAAVWLFVSGLIGLVSFSKHKRLG